MGYIGKKPATQGKDAGPALKLDDISSDFDGLTSTFSLSVDGTSISPHVNNISVYLSGVYQIPGNSYSLSGSYIVFTGAPSASLDFHGAILGSTRIIVPDNDTIETAAFTDNTRSAISGSFRTELSGSHVKLVGGGVSGSSTSLGSFGNVVSATHITASGNISASGIVIADTFQSTGGSVDGISFTDDLNITGNITASGDISGSGNIFGTGNLDIDGTSNLQGNVTLQNDLTVVDINASGNITGSVVSASSGKFTSVDIDGGTIIADSFTGTFDGALSSSAQIATSISGSLGANASTIRTLSAATVSGSLGANAGVIRTLSAATVSGSFGNQRVGTTDDVKFANITGSNDISASGNLSITGNVDVDGTSNFAGNVTLQNDLVVTGRIDAEEIHTTFISSSITQATGSNIFGDSVNDLHQFTGSIDVSGSGTVLKVSDGNVVVSDTLTATNIGAFTAAGAIDFNDQNMTNVDIDSGTITGLDTDLAVADGGTGASTFTDGGVLLGSGTSAITAMAVLTDGQMIVGDGTTDPVAESGATLRTSIGVGLTDDVVFSEISGSDTTLTGHISASGEISSSSDLGTDGDLYVGGRITGSSGATFADNVGIGAPLTLPVGVALDITGSSDQQIRIGAAARAQLQFNGTKTTNAEFAEISFANGGDSVAGIQVYRQGANDQASMQFLTQATGGSVATRMTISGSGNVGIGTTNPTAQLSLVSGTYGFENLFGLTDHACLGLGLGPGSTSNYIRTVIGTTYGMGIMHTASATVGSAKLEVITTAENSAGGAAPTRLATFLANGKVGIGDDAPPAMLSIKTAAQSKIVLENSGDALSDGDLLGEIQFVGNDATSNANGTRASISGITQNGSGGAYLAFSTANSSAANAEAMRIIADGKVGIGITAPTAPLHIKGAPVQTSGARSAQLYIEDTTAFGSVQNSGIQFRQEWQSGSTTSTSAIVGLRTSTSSGNYGGALIFQTRANGADLADNMIIGDDGNVGIGTTSPGRSVQIGLNQSAHQYLRISSATSHEQGIEFSVNNTAVWQILNTSADILSVFDISDSSTAASISAGDNDWQAGSDLRIKKDIVNIDSTLDKINELRPITWKRKYGNLDRTYPGLVAQEVLPHFPLVVGGTEDSFEEITEEVAEGEDIVTSRGGLSIGYNNLVPYLIKAVQELSAKVEALENA